VSGESYGALLDAVRGVHWPARRLVTTAAAGSHPSRRRGTSAEFSEYRAYRQGDDPRRVDWRLLARSDRAYIRLATDRTVLSTMIVLDASASMAFPVTSRAKWRQAQQLAIGLAAIAHGDGDPVGIVVQDDSSADGTRVLPPRTRRGVVSEIARLVDDADPDGIETLAPVLGRVRSRRIALITDLLGDADALLTAARVHVSSGGELAILHVVAREELDPPRRTLLAADPENAAIQRLLIDGGRREYERRFGEWRAAEAHRWRAAGAVYALVTDDEPAARAVRRIVEPLVRAGITP
jgi:uncharacterized protein (DUF58 family)